MTLKRGIGKTGVALAALLAIAMCVLSLIFHPVYIPAIPYGICLPSPDCLVADPVVSWGVNIVLIALITVLLWALNRTFNFIRTTEPALLALFMIMACSTPWFTQSLNTSIILCLANVVALGIMFGCYDIKNATRQMFGIGVIVGFGSMFQYAFLPMAFVYLLWALVMKVLRIKETMALIAGIICPYWIALGIGFIELSQLQFPSITPLFESSRDYTDLLLLIIAICVATGIGFLVSLINFMKLFAGNSKVNAMNLCINILGAASVVCIVVDYDNMPAYVVTLFMAAGVQLANICALWNPQMPWLVTAIPSVCYLAIFVCSLIF